MTLGGLNVLTVGTLFLAMAFGSILTLIGAELHKKYRKKIRRQLKPAMDTEGDKEKKRRQDLVVELMNLYSGVHSSGALSEFLNKELERRQEYWRVRIPGNGPGEIYDLDPA